jgi:hypothetical protein
MSMRKRVSMNAHTCTTQYAVAAAKIWAIPQKGTARENRTNAHVNISTTTLVLHHRSGDDILSNQKLLDALLWD